MVRVAASITSCLPEIQDLGSSQLPTKVLRSTVVAMGRERLKMPPESKVCSDGGIDNTHQQLKATMVNSTLTGPFLGTPSQIKTLESQGEKEKKNFSKLVLGCGNHSDPM